MTASVELRKLSPANRAITGLSPARWTTIDRWHVPLRFREMTEEASALRTHGCLMDLCWWRRTEVLSGSHSAALDVGRLDVAAGPLVRCRLTARRLLTCSATDSEPVSGYIISRDSGFAHYLVAGPRVADVLRRLTPLDLRDRVFPDRSCALCPIAGISGIVLRRERAGLPAYELLVSREYGEYLWNVLYATGKPLNVVPAGSATARSLES